MVYNWPVPVHRFMIVAKRYVSCCVVLYACCLQFSAVTLSVLAMRMFWFGSRAVIGKNHVKCSSVCLVLQADFFMCFVVLDIVK